MQWLELGSRRRAPSSASPSASSRIWGHSSPKSVDRGGAEARLRSKLRRSRGTVSQADRAGVLPDSRASALCAAAPPRRDRTRRLRALVRREGVEGALARLADAGVHLQSGRVQGAPADPPRQPRDPIVTRAFRQPLVPGTFRSERRLAQHAARRSMSTSSQTRNDADYEALFWARARASAAAAGMWRPAPPFSAGCQHLHASQAHRPDAAASGSRSRSAASTAPPGGTGCVLELRSRPAAGTAAATATPARDPDRRGLAGRQWLGEPSASGDAADPEHSGFGSACGSPRGTRARARHRRRACSCSAASR